jgi:hypothetical protein
LTKKQTTKEASKSLGEMKRKVRLISNVFDALCTHKPNKAIASPPHGKKN